MVGGTALSGLREMREATGRLVLTHSKYGEYI
jgi:hypothetical protein